MFGSRGIARYIFLNGVIALLSLLPTHASYPKIAPESPCDQVIKHGYYKLCYLDKYRLSLWTTHELTPQSIRGNQKRTDNYRLDPRLFSSFEGVEGGDYRRSGFDRGHLVPAADMRLNYQAMSESFYMTNMTPQAPGFNRGIWQSLERLCRNLVLNYGAALVITAPVLEEGLGQLKKGITIPKMFYKILYWPKKDLMMAFLLPNQKQSGLEPQDFQVTVDEVEQQTGLDFFAHLPDSLEDQLESRLSSIPFFKD